MRAIRLKQNCKVAAIYPNPIYKGPLLQKFVIIAHCFCKDTDYSHLKSLIQKIFFKNEIFNQNLLTHILFSDFKSAAQRVRSSCL